MTLRLALSAALMLLVSACMAPDNPLALSEVESLRLAEVSVKAGPKVFVSDPAGEEEYLASKGLSGSEPASLELLNTAEAKAYLQARVARRLDATYRSALAPVLRGGRPARLEVTIKQLDVPSAVRKVLLGGHNMLVTDVALVDATTGRTILAYNDQATMIVAGNGVLGVVVDAAIQSASEDDTLGRLSRKHAQGYVDWLLKK